jgi:hypothetical protein
LRIDEIQASNSERCSRFLLVTWIRKSLVRVIINMFAVSGVERGHTDSAADSRLYPCNSGYGVIFPGYCTCREEG